MNCSQDLGINSDESWSSCRDSVIRMKKWMYDWYSYSRLKHKMWQQSMDAALHVCNIKRTLWSNTHAWSTRCPSIAHLLHLPYSRVAPNPSFFRSLSIPARLDRVMTLVGSICKWYTWEQECLSRPLGKENAYVLLYSDVVWNSNVHAFLRRSHSFDSFVGSVHEIQQAERHSFDERPFRLSAQHLRLQHKCLHAENSMLIRLDKQARIQSQYHRRSMWPSKYLFLQMGVARQVCLLHDVGGKRPALLACTKTQPLEPHFHRRCHASQASPRDCCTLRCCPDRSAEPSCRDRQRVVGEDLRESGADRTV